MILLCYNKLISSSTNSALDSKSSRSSEHRFCFVTQKFKYRNRFLLIPVLKDTLTTGREISIRTIKPTKKNCHFECFNIKSSATDNRFHTIGNDLQFDVRLAFIYKFYDS